MANLLFEIGMEEMPAQYLPASIAQLQSLAREKFSQARLDYAAIKVYSTPRRFALYVMSLADSQDDMVTEVRGPSTKVAFDTDGNPTKAALGFARGQKVNVDDLISRETDSGVYVFAPKREQGRPTLELLPGLLQDIVQGLTFPRPMRWGDGEQRFIRPIRWIVALYGCKLVKVTIGGLHSDRTTRGHRSLGTPEIVLRSAEHYEQTLENNYVIADPDKRRTMILQQISEIARGSLVKQYNAFVKNNMTAPQGTRDEKFHFEVDMDEALLTEVVHLVEYPTAFVGSFDAKYLEMPPKAITTPMKEHQRYFPVMTKTGELLPKFVGVRNGNELFIDVVQQGNERVLEARLADAKFFFEEDKKTPLKDYVPCLKSVIFQEDLGTLWDKVERIGKNVAYLGSAFRVASTICKDAQRAALLCKADLVTHMVYEFPELQGVLGRQYALLSGEAPSVALAIEEHHMPRSANDTVPTSPAGTLVSLADKMDTVAGCLAVGIGASGSQDPYGLRRQALAICNILLKNKLNLSLSAFIKQSLQHIENVSVNVEDTTKSVYDFFERRVRTILADLGFTYDVIEAVLASGYDDVVQVVNRAHALSVFKASSDIEALLTAYTRAHNLAQHAEGLKIREDLLHEATEKELFVHLVNAQKNVETCLENEDYEGGLKIIAELEAPINTFFKDIMVMTEDEDLRKNRLALLANISRLVLPIADLSKVVVG